MLQQAGVHTDFIAQKEGSSGHTIIQSTPQGENNIILFGGANQTISKEDVDKVLGNFEKGDYMVLQNEISQIPYVMCCFSFIYCFFYNTFINVLHHSSD